MNRNKLKTYAPKARRDFIAAVAARAIKFGISKDAIEPVQVQGNVALIAGQAHPRKVADQRSKLESRVKNRGFEQVMEEAAYTWFNRFAAIRYMEVHGYLDHGYRVLSHPEGKATPEIVEHAQHLDLPGLDKEKVIELKLDGTKEGDLYRMLLMAQCNALNAAMPFLFERIDDETELLLPDNLLHSDSVIRQMVNEIEEADWQEIEIIGWLYQFYISEKKDQVIGKVVKSEDIPAATQLFTPNWIVKYMVQNTLGAKWLATYPQSGIRAKMEFYIEPAEQTDEVKAKLAAITPKELNPEEITFLDPACGSGHILVEAYDLFKEIYLERGYVLRDVPRLILEKNLFGLDIDDRAAQMAAFALLMKARADDRRVFDRSISMNVMAIQDSKGLDAKEICRVLVPDERFELVPTYDLLPGTLPQPTMARRAGGTLGVVIQDLIELFQDGKALGSLTMMPSHITLRIPEICVLSEEARKGGGTLIEFGIQRHVSEHFVNIVKQAKLLASSYDCVAANPPYIGGGYLNATLKQYIKRKLSGFHQDLYASFIFRSSEFISGGGHSAFMTPITWMFISSYKEFREFVLKANSITSLVRPEYHAFFDSAFVPICTLALRRIGESQSINGTYIDLGSFYGESLQPLKLLEAINSNGCAWKFFSDSNDFADIPGTPIAYWLEKGVRDCFSLFPKIKDFAETRKGMVTADTSRYIRYWFEVSIGEIGLVLSRREAKESGKKWFPYLKGGGFRRWSGNEIDVVNWYDDGRELQTTKHKIDDRIAATNFNLEYIFRPNISWGSISSSAISARISFGGALFDTAGCACFPSESHLRAILGVLNSTPAYVFLNAMNPTLNFPPGVVGELPYPAAEITSKLDGVVSRLIKIMGEEWDANEISRGFISSPIYGGSLCCEQIGFFRSKREELSAEIAALEDENDKLVINAFGIDSSCLTIVAPRTTIDQISDGQEVKKLISYAIGGMMGRYSLDEPGLIYANSGNVGFDPSRYTAFPADDDGIVPIMQTDWFDDDATNRVVEFIKVAWSPETLAENLKFVADSLGGKSGELPIDTIRRYLSTDFFKDHLKTYKKRPIYWLFSSGKEKAFEALVYLHRYNEGTLSRMRMEYVTPLQGRIASKIDQLGRDIDAAASTAAQNKLRKEQEKLKKQQAELVKFDEELRHYADMRIKLDLDDGVKVNYGKFGNLLAETKAITGGSDE
ncbi:BREX-1 system adenine-specific DNA-methyltransferase PglX [Paramagnetospirillum caucaseum]|nr:BREX-1 system adenine-specific DNA-methyltransferase PglX [Paramagnetospirillum caucaseum]